MEKLSQIGYTCLTIYKKLCHLSTLREVMDQPSQNILISKLAATLVMKDAFHIESESNEKIEDLIRIHPDVWDNVKKKLTPLFRDFKAAQIAEYAERMKREISSSKGKSDKYLTKKLYKNDKKLIEARISLWLMGNFLRRMVSPSSKKGLCFIDRIIAQNLFFTRGYKRRFVSIRRFKLFWSLIRDKVAVVGKIQEQGIFCVFSTELGRSLAKLIGTQKTIEIGAGDGTLTLLLEKFGVRADATDDYSWKHRVRYPDWVEPLSAGESLKKFDPEVVICSWPPPGNNFEHLIFKSENVKMYIAIGSRHEFASGNRSAYKNASDFTCERSERLSRLLLPEELDNEVLIFRRIRGGQIRD
ncbi:MAG: hypothetical protein HQK54_10015 [Oligoflexales bacterium]|nr:hypothetical protein [Oligoflexales bacterium]